MPPGDMCQYLEMFLVVITVGLGGQRLLAPNGEKPRLLQGVLQHTGQPLTTENDPAPSVDGAEVKKPWFGTTDVD